MDNIQSQFPGDILIINTKSYKEWTITAPMKTLQDMQHPNFLYELSLKSTPLLIQAKHAPEIGLSQYPSMNNESFHLYDITSEISKNVFDPHQNDILLDQYIVIHASRYSSFIEY